jgi:hypothetical protein
LNHKKQEEDCLFGSFLCSFKGILVCQDHAVVVVIVAVLSLKGRSIADKWILRLRSPQDVQADVPSPDQPTDLTSYEF